MLEFTLVAIIILAIMIPLLKRRKHHVHWPGHLHRLHAGVPHRAEWMAPDEIVRGVETDYLAAQTWAEQAVFNGYLRFLNEAPRYFSGAYLERQRKIANLHIQSIRGVVRLVGVLRTQHHLRVRHFSDDGLTCYLVDRQPSRKMITYEYWQARDLHAQELDPGAYVYKMKYDEALQHWKIDDFVQQLPRGWENELMADTAIQLDETLPIASGRDT